MPYNPARLSTIASKEVIIIQRNGKNALNLLVVMETLPNFNINVIGYTPQCMVLQILPFSSEANAIVKDFINSNA